MSAILDLLHYAAIGGAAIVALSFGLMWIVDCWQLRQCARRGHDFAKGSVCRRCEAPRPAMRGKGF